MKNGWKTVPLEGVAVQQKGTIKIGPFGSQLKKCDLVSSGIHVIGIENVLSETFDGLGGRFISPQKFQTLRTVEILPGDLLVTMMGTIGKVAVVPDGIGTSIMDSHLLRVRPDTSLCRTDYLKWAIYGSPAVQESMDAQAHGAIMKGLNSAIVRSLPILLPPLPEQQRIVGILDGAFDGIATAKASAEKNLKNARALFESHLQAVFSQRGEGWVAKRLGDVCDLIDCLHKTPTYVETGFPMVRVTDIKPGTLDLLNTRRVDVKTFNEFSKKHSPKAGDIVFSRVGSYGVSSLVSSDEPFCLGQNTVFIIPKINSLLLYHFLNSPIAKNQFDELVDGTTQPTISLKSIREVRFFVPPLRDHNKLAATLNEVWVETQHLESIYQQKLAALEALKKSLLHQAFIG